MTPLWFPKNIQKRLLLYVLQQLSFFSGIDIPNLEEISLRNIILRNLSVDPDKLGKLPGCHFRHGLIGTIELSTTSTGSLMSGGLHITASNVELVISPNLNLDESLNESLMFTLAQSTVGLANSLLIDPETAFDDETLSASPLQEHLSRPDSDASKNSKSSPLGSMMQRAAELAMARLLVTIKDLRLKVVTDSADVVFKVGEISLETIDGRRHVDLVAVELVSPHAVEPQVPQVPQERPLENPLTASTNHVSDVEESLYMSAFSDPAERASDSAASTILSQVLMCIDSIKLSFEGAEAIFGLDIKIGTIVVALPSLLSTLGIILDNFSRNLTRDDLKSTFKHGANSKFPNASHPTAIATEEAQSSTYEGPDSDQNSQDSADASSHTATRLVEKINISTIILCVDSGISTNGEYDTPNSTRIVLRDFTFVRKDDRLAFGGIRRVKAIRTQSDKSATVLFHFNDLKTSGTSAATSNGAIDTDVKADVRFEWYEPSKVSDIARVSVLLSKPANFALCPESAAAWSDCSESVERAFRSYNAFTLNVARLSNSSVGLRDSSSPSAQAAPSTVFNFHTSTIHISVKSIEDAELHLKVSPIHYEPQRSLFKAAEVYLDLIRPQPASAVRIGSIFKLAASIEPRAFTSKVSSKLESSDPGFNSPTTKARFSITCKYVRVKAGIDIFEKVALVISSFEKEKSRVHAAMKRAAFNDHAGTNLRDRGKLSLKSRRPRFASSHKLDFRGREASILAKIEKADISIENLGFGIDALEACLDEVDVYLLQGQFFGSVRMFMVSMESLSENLKDCFVESVRPNPESSAEPMLSFACTANSDTRATRIVVSNTRFEYYTKWLEVFNTPSKAFNDAGENASIPSESCKQIPESYNTATVSTCFHQCVIGLNPGRLRSKAYISIPEGSVELDMHHASPHTMEFANISLLLIDEKCDEHCRSHKHSSKNAMAGIVDVNHEAFFHNLGYVTVAASTLVVGSAQAAPLDPSTRESAMEFKVNVGDCDLKVCADSFYTLTQVLNDLKLPFHLSADEKYKVVVDAPTDLMAGMDAEFFKKCPATSPVEASRINPIQTNSTLLLMIDLKIDSLHAYLHDGFDWKETRRSIRAAVRKMEKAKNEPQHEHLAKRAGSTSFEELTTRRGDFSGHLSTPIEEEDNYMEETIFHSIHLTMPPDGLLARRINETIQGASGAFKETEKARINSSVGKNYKNLHLNRAASHSFAVVVDKAKVQLRIFHQDAEGDAGIVSSATVRIEDLSMFDNVFTSTWNKFLGYMTVLGERELNSNILELEIESVRPQAGLAYTESIISLRLLPLRAYIDQDTLNFLLRFLEFSDERFQLPPEEMTFFQSVALGKLQIKLDYKPKRIDFAGIRSGRASEFANFFVLDGADIKLPSVKQFGILGFSRLGTSIMSAWAPSFRQKQVIDIIAGMSPFRPLVNIGGGMKDLVTIPVHEYKSKNGHMMRGLQRGSKKFARTAGYEILMMGAKMTGGAQALLEQGEAYLGGEGSRARNQARAPPLIERSHREKMHDSRGAGSGRGRSSAERSPPIDSLNFEIEYLDESRGHPNVLSKSLYVLKPTLSEPNQSGGMTEYGEDSMRDFEESTIFDERAGPEKNVSLYANQPESVREGLAMALHSVGNTAKTTSKMFQRIKEDVTNSNSLSEQVGEIARSSPVLLIRPLIGTTEAISKTLMGLSNGIDSRHIRDLKEKYARQEPGL